MGLAMRIEPHHIVEWKEIGPDRETADIQLYNYSLGLLVRRNIANVHLEIVHELNVILHQQRKVMIHQNLK